MACNSSKYELMRLKKSGEIVRVYSFNMEKKEALIWSEVLYNHQNGNGWNKIPYKLLVPMEYEINPSERVSKTKKNKAKDRLKLVTALWMTSDGCSYSHAELDKAIEHELELMQHETESIFHD